MYSKNLGSFVAYCFGLTLLTILIFAALQWLNIPAGHFVDWLIGILTMWWLLVIVTVPWNVHFEAKAVLAEAAQSAASKIDVDQKQLKYVSRVAGISLVIAILLHLFSALGLFALSAYGITPVGYIGSGAALLLTLLRPSVRAYQYLWERLLAIKQQVKYPREDVLELRSRTKQLESMVQHIQVELDPAQPKSFAAQQSRSLDELRERLQTVATQQHRLEDENQREHERLLREGQNAVAKLSADSKFLDHFREIVRMIKSA